MVLLITTISLVYILWFTDVEFSSLSTNNSQDAYITTSKEESRGTDKDQRLRAQEDLEHLLLIVAKVKLLNPQLWTTNNWKDVEKLLAEGEMHYRRTHFNLAKKKYHDAILKASEIIDSAEKIKIKNITIGNTAIKKWDSVTAERAFKIVLGIEPANPDGITGLQRSRVLEKVKTLMEQGKKYENSGQLDEAQKAYESALVLDKKARGAKPALIRLSFKQRPILYRSYISSGLALLQNNKFKEAERFLKKAQAIDNSIEVQEALSFIKSNHLTHKINQALKKARAAEKSEDWGLAAESFDGVLKLDAGMTSLIKKKKNALKRASLDKNIEALLNKPHAIDQVIDVQEAKSLLKQARLLLPKQTRINAQIKLLEKKLQASKAPISIKLESDGLTTVQIAHIMVLEPFKSEVVQLVPGIYTLEGTCASYQPIKTTIRISNLTHTSASRIKIACSQKNRIGLGQ